MYLFHFVTIICFFPMLERTLHGFPERYVTTYNAQRYVQILFYAIKINFFLASDNFHISFWKPSLPAVRQFYVHPFTH